MTNKGKIIRIKYITRQMVRENRHQYYVFSDNMIHLGGDEVIGDCYKENPNITQFMKDNNITEGDYDGLVTYHQNKSRTLLRQFNKDKVGVYWSNLETYYQTYQDDDVIVYWGLTN